MALALYMFTLIHFVTLVGNFGITLVLLGNHLHIPMCSFLSDLSLVDLGYSIAVTPKVIAESL